MSLDLLVMTGDQPRHLHFAASLLEAFPSSAHVVERFHEARARNYTTHEESPLIRGHLESFVRTEARLLEPFVAAKRGLLNSKLVGEVEPGGINDDKVFELIDRLDPKLIAVHSTSIIGPRLISRFPKRLINLHAGLSPYYRGAGTNLFPFLDDRLDLVGMTIHYIDQGIDSGEIILQGRPTFEPQDDTHTIGCKNVILGAHLMRRVVERYLTTGHPPPSIPQDLTRGKLIRRADFGDGVIVKIQENLEAGMVERHIKDPRAAPIVEW